MGYTRSQLKQIIKEELRKQLNEVKYQDEWAEGDLLVIRKQDNDMSINHVGEDNLQKVIDKYNNPESDPYSQYVWLVKVEKVLKSFESEGPLFKDEEY